MTIKVTRFRTLLTPCIKKTKKNKEEKWVNSVNYLSEPWVIVIHINDNGSSIIIYRGPLIEHAKEQTILNKANYHKVYLVLIQCNKMCYTGLKNDWVHSLNKTRRFHHLADDKVSIEQILFFVLFIPLLD